jgi:hypothetical protein
MTRPGQSDVEVDEKSGVIRGGVDLPGHFGIVLEERPFHATPDALAEDASARDMGKELKTERINEIATQNTGQVVRDVGADVLATIEVDNRTALLRFNEQTLPAVNAEPYPHVMLIEDTSGPRQPPEEQGVRHPGRLERPPPSAGGAGAQDL